MTPNHANGSSKKVFVWEQKRTLSSSRKIRLKLINGREEQKRDNNKQTTGLLDCLIPLDSFTWPISGREVLLLSFDEPIHTNYLAKAAIK